jgi:hypothetical protein
MKKLESGNKVKIIDGNIDVSSIKDNISSIIEFLQEELLNKCNIVVQFSPSRSVSAESI